jgi:hypothetical protein
VKKKIKLEEPKKNDLRVVKRLTESAENDLLRALSEISSMRNKSQEEDISESYLRKALKELRIALRYL